MSAPWWQPRGVLRRFVADLAADELARARRAPQAHPLPWPDDLRWEDELGVDSLERLALASALAEALHLHESGIEDQLLARRSLGEWVDVAATGLARFSDRLTFRTSGSTGQPKPCTHALGALRQETAHLATLFAGRQRVLAAVPSHHIYGFLFTVLLPRDLALPAESVRPLRASTPAWLAQGAQPGDLVVGHPEFWAAAARAVPRWPADVVGVTSTAPCPDVVAEHLCATGLARLVQVYGSSESAGIGARASPREPYRLFPYWSFDASAPARLLRELPGGGQQPFAALDRLVPSGERCFEVGGRTDHAVQVGGVNVFPARVRDVLRRHPAVHDAAVRLMRPDEGTRLKAFVVPKPDAPADLLRALQRWIDRELTAPERPKALRLGPRLPASPSGKAADWSVNEG